MYKMHVNTMMPNIANATPSPYVIIVISVFVCLMVLF